MKIKIVNAQDKSTVYLVEDSTPSLNIPRLKEQELLAMRI